MVEKIMTHPDAVNIIEQLNKKEVTSEQVVKEHIEKIKTLNRTVNAVTHERFDVALAEAKQADEIRATKDKKAWPPLLGVPITIKEMFDLEGYPTTGGVGKHKERVATEDAEIVKRLKEAGAIILAKTNASTLTMAHETDNVLFGRTNHPLDPEHTPGGSSGGEAALIGSGASLWGVGSDLGGSIRLPSHFCGLAGLRPSHDRIPTDGEFPHIPHQAHMNSIGPMARSVADVKLLYTILSGHEPEDIAREDIDMFWLDDAPKVKLQDEIALGIQLVITKLEKASGHALPKVSGDFLAGVVDLWQATILQDGGKAIEELIKETEPFTFWREMAKIPSTQTTYHPWILMLLFGAKAFGPGKRKVRDLHQKTEQVRDAFGRVTHQRGVLLTPVYPTTAPKHGEIVKKVFSNRSASLFPFITVANVMGYPAMTVPIGRTADGFPFGIQIIGNYHQEAAVLKTAEWIEDLVIER